MSSSSVKTGVVGATGYTGSELVQLLANHPTFDCVLATSRQHAGSPLSDVYPELKHDLDVVCRDPQQANLTDCDLLFLAVPHGTSMEMVPDLLESNTRVVDLAGDYRVSDRDRFEASYDMEHSDPGNLSRAVYGLSECNRDRIKGATFVSNPGCYVTSFLLPMTPLVEKGLVQSPLFVDSKSGISGAGRTPSDTTTFMNVNNEVKPYNVGTHRHQQEMSYHLPDEHSITFVPHVVSAERGIESAIYARSHEGEQRIEHVLRQFCSEFSVLRYREQPAGIKAVAGTSYCDISVYSEDDRVVVFSCLDNLRKGAASQAIQNANLMFDRPMDEGVLE